MQHVIIESKDQTNSKQSFHHWGGLALSQELKTTTTEPILQLIREDGLCEFWYDEKPTWKPKNGWIEIMQNATPKALKDMSIDNSIAHAESLFESLNH